MLNNLRQLKDKQSATAKNMFNQAIADFSGAAASDGAATNFYLEAVRVTQFVGQNREQTSFHDWKKKDGSKINAAGVETCLQYMVLTLRRSAGATDAQIFPSLLAYAQNTQANIANVWDSDVARQPVTSNIFARWYNLSSQFENVDNWEMNPTNTDGMYEKVLLPYMRKTHDRRILDYWDAKLADESAKASAAKNEFATDTYNSNRRPELLWGRAEDEVAIGMRDQGLTEMYNIVKGFPTHPSAAKWIDELQGLLTAASAPAAPRLAAPSGPAAPAVPAIQIAPGGSGAQSTDDSVLPGAAGPSVPSTVSAAGTGSAPK